LALLAASVTWMLYRKRETPTRLVPIDYVGLIALIIWVGALQIMLDKGNELDWFASTQIVILAIVAAVGFCFFLIWEFTEAHPIVDLSLLRRRNFWSGTLALAVGYGVFFGNVVLMPLWLQQDMGYTATIAGAVLAPVGLLAILFSPWVGKNVHKYDPRLFATVAFSIFAADFMDAFPIYRANRFCDHHVAIPDPGHRHGSIFYSADDPDFFRIKPR